MRTILLSFKQFSNSNLHVFSENVVEKTKGVAAYAAEQPQVLIVETATLAFANALLDAATRDKVKIEIRNQKRLVLENELSQLARLLELHTAKSEDFFTAAGFQLRAKPVLR